ncbi:MAG: RagB/SusD family nutrient uptake outer membrane protein, partial [Bacteroidales bacterium]|nr:RagB/SusD family nutrient uptake outer membrane protein [Bacteroidales bacterium]
LMHSELTRTVDGINKVRARVNLAPIGAYTDEALRMERKHELAFEAVRWGDMRRYGKAYAIAALETQLGQEIRNAGGETVMKDQGAGYKARYEATYGFRPIPRSEISLSNGVLKQNEGWTDTASAQYAGWK